MNVFLSHINMMPFLYGVILFLSAFLVIRNIARGRIMQAIAVSAILWVGFQMHGHHVESRMGVAIAALLLDLTWSWMFPRRR
jgi:uncharacterized membrane protein (UPF0136 family)